MQKQFGLMTWNKPEPNGLLWKTILRFAPRLQPSFPVKKT